MVHILREVGWLEKVTTYGLSTLTVILQSEGLLTISSWLHKSRSKVDMPKSNIMIVINLDTYIGVVRGKMWI